MDTTSETLLQRLRDPAQPLAWERFVRLYTPFLLYWGRRLGLAPVDAADLVQDVFTTLVQKLPEFQYDQERSFRAWLRTIAINKWRDRQRRHVLPQAAEAELSGVAGPDGVEEVWESEHRHFLLKRALELMRLEFEPNTWRACWDSVALGKPASEIAAALGLTENAVYIARCRVLWRLRQELAGLLE